MNSTGPLTCRPALRSAAAILLITASLSGCAPVSPTASEDRALFERLCDAPNRNFVKYRPKIDGYSEGFEHERMQSCPRTGTPFRRLVVDGYRFYECFQTPWANRSNGPLKVIRVELMEKGDPSCQLARLENENKLAATNSTRYPSLTEECFGGRELDNPTSQYLLIRGWGVVDKYGKHLSKRPRNWPKTPGAISYSRDRIIKLDTGEIIVELKKYQYFPSGSAFSDFTGSTKCDDGWTNISQFMEPRLHN